MAHNDKSSDEINHPAHYGGADDPFEPIKIIEARNLGFHEGNALKYLLRAGYKPGESEATDLSKAVWYLNRRIEQLENEKGQRAVRCPYCVKEGHRSTLQNGNPSTTLIGYSGYYDQNGNRHNHDPNRTTIHYQCSRGHRYLITSRPPCPSCNYGHDADQPQRLTDGPTSHH